jgi:5-formaminoimidazole-4-carboxamide-1-(beta)-D-ribofuranosyl 5'-monophosphate synthetase
MAIKNKIDQVLKSYDQNNIRIASLGGHSALDVCRGAKAEGFETVVVAERGREKTYEKFYKTRGEKGCVDHIILVDKFADIVRPEIQEKLRKLNAIFVHSRYFWVYCDYKQIENNFLVPIFGNRILVRKEERTEDKNQYFLLGEAGIKIPKQFSQPEDIDRLVLVKAAEAARGYERAFFLVGNYAEYKSKAKELINKNVITQDSLDEAVIEEFVVGPQLNLNFFYSPIDDDLELVGTDTRRQTNLDGILRLTAPEQVEVLKYVSPKYIENGHIAVTIKESLLEKAYDAGENFVRAVAKHYPPGMVGPFALQGAITAGPPKEELVVFDVSMRIPGSPGTMFTPYSYYMHGESLSVGRRIAKEISLAIEKARLSELLT